MQKGTPADDALCQLTYMGTSARMLCQSEADISQTKRATMATDIDT